MSRTAATPLAAALLLVLGLSAAPAIAQNATPAAAPAAVEAPAAEAAPHLALQARWAEIKYAMPEDRRADAFEALATEADAAVALHPRDAALLTWRGIVLASWAGAKGGLGALSLARRAKADFEAAIAIDPSALDGSAHTSLGSLYYQVPGWPVGFGDDDKAREHLQAGLALNPDGIDSLYFWGDFLRDQGDEVSAIDALAKALQAAPRPGREAADAGRRAEIEALLAQLRG